MAELTINKDFTIEQLRLGANNGKPKEERLEKAKPKKEKAKPKRIIGNPVAVAQKPPKPKETEKPKLFVARGFADRVHAYMKRKGFDLG